MNYPKHVAIIPDGNRTRAKENNIEIAAAYRISYQKAVELLRYTFENTEAKVFTLWGLSTENSKKRPPEEYTFLMNMYKSVGTVLDEILTKNQVNFKWIGNPEDITDGFKNYLNEKQETLKFPTDKYFVFAVNYGGRDEILRGIQKLAHEGQDLTQISEEKFSQALDLGNIPAIELVIRTKGDQAQRTSGFMSRWIGYAELYFTNKKCPEFWIPEYEEALRRFDTIESHRNFWK